MRFLLLAAASTLALSGCNYTSDDDADARPAEAASSESATSWQPDPMASNDPRQGETMQGVEGDDRPRPVMQAQVVLDRLGFGPGVIDGKDGMSTANALRGFQEANNLPVTGEMDQRTKSALSQWSNIAATRVVTIPESFASEEFSPVPDEAAEQAERERLGYESLMEKLAERFHTTSAVLKELNPGGRPAGSQASGNADPDAMTSNASARTSNEATAPAANAQASASSDAAFFRAGQKIRVPNIGADRIDPEQVDDPKWLDTLTMLGVGTDQPELARIVVDKSEGVLRGYDANDKLTVLFTVTSGSSNDPLPLGDWEITGIAKNPPFAYNPELFWDVPDTDPKLDLPPGPNGPVGVVWIDLSKEHYGIHGTPAPETIGRAQSHGCVRLTNWDAARLAQMVSTSTKVVFQA